MTFPEGTWVDVLAAENAAREAEGFLETDELDSATAAAELAESVTRSPFLPGDDGPWVEEKRRELSEVRARALNTLAEASLRTDKPAEAVRWASLAIEAEPFRESGYRSLMEAHVAAGNRGEALRVYERCRRLLAEELGSYPSPETEAISLDEAALVRAPPHSRSGAGRQEDLVALQLPPPCGLVQVPDIDFPLNVPLYLAPTLTAPNLIFPFFTLPAMPYFPCGFESVMCPCNCEPVCFQ